MQMGNIMSTTTITDVEKLIERRKWILNELRQLEEKYKMTTEEFINKWKKGLIPEPEKSGNSWGLHCMGSSRR